MNSSVPHRAARLAALATVLAMAVAACGDDGTASGPGDESGGTLVVAMTAAQIPSTDTVMAFAHGFEGNRFVNFQLYDALTGYDLAQDTEIPEVVPSLATSWETSPDGLTWTFTLREDVRFSDGTPFDADAVVFAFDRLLNEDAEFFYPEAAASAALWASSIASYRKADDGTVEITTHQPNGHLLTDLTFLTIPSPTAVREHGNSGYAAHASGTGPFVLESVETGRQLTMRANEDHWRGAPDLDRVVLRPMPDTSARIAALRSGEVNWIEYPNPDDIRALEQEGYELLVNDYDHLWFCTFDQSREPWSDVRVRQAVNFAIDREAIAEDLLAGTAVPAYQHAPVATTVYTPENDLYTFDQDRARALLEEAGYGDGFSSTWTVPTGGSGNLVPVPIATTIQSQLAEVGIDIEIRTIEWAAFLADLSAGQPALGSDVQCASTVTYQAEPLVRAFWNRADTRYRGHYDSAVVDELSGQAEQTIDQETRIDLYRQAEAQVSADAPSLFVVSDRNPRVVAPQVDGVIQPKSWFIDLTTVSVAGS